MEQVIGVDIGGTKIAVAAISEKGDLSETVVIASQTKTAELMYQSVVSAINQFLTKSDKTIDDFVGIGVGVPGKVDREAGVAVFQNNLPWTDFPIVDRLKETFGDCLVVIDNDVYQAAFAEWAVAKIAPEDIFVYYTISTGIACSLIQGGQFLRGCGFAGEAGLLPVIDPRAGKKTGRLEELAAGPALELRARELYKKEGISTEELFNKYHAGDEIAQEIVDQLIESLTHSIYGLICLIDPKKIIFGGSISIHQPFIVEKIKERLAAYVIPAQKEAIERLFVSPLQNNAGIIGAGLQVFH